MSWRILTDYIEMTERELEDLLEYSLTLPTGQVVGKKWRRLNVHVEFHWMLGEYVDEDGANIRWTPIRVIYTDPQRALEVTAHRARLIEGKTTPYDSAR
jgi:hypothetical protein